MVDQPVERDAARERILQAAFKVLSRHGYGKFNLTDVALQAGISRPTLYKSFASKDALLAAFSDYEVALVRQDFTQAVDGLKGRDRLNAMLTFLADFYASYQMRGLLEIEPTLVLNQLSSALPALSSLVATELEGHVRAPDTVAITLVRLAVCHYLVPASDEVPLRVQLASAASVR